MSVARLPLEDRPPSIADYLPAFARNLHPAQQPAEKGHYFFEERVGVVAVADISGFTALTESCAALGAVGAERVHHLLDAFYDALIGEFNTRGGEVIDFAGDAVIAAWFTDGRDALGDCTRRVVEAAWRVVAMLDDYPVAIGPDSPEQRLRVRVVVCGGAFNLAIVGGVFDRWLTVMGGQPFGSLLRGLAAGGPGSVLVHDATAPGHLAGHYVADTPFIETLRPPDRDTADHAVPAEPAPLRANVARRYLPAALAESLELWNPSWLAEFRNASVMFVRYPDVAHFATGSANLLNSVVRATQVIVEGHNGVVLSLTTDDKGTYAIAVWGLPHASRGDNAVRAREAARQIASRLYGMGCSTAIGIADGRVMCGSRGGRGRYQYAVAGDTVNVAARLMTLADGTILALADQGEIIAIRGRAHPIHAEQLRWDRPEVHTARRVPEEPAQHPFQPLHGRDFELEALRQKLTAVRAGRNGVVVIEGEAGIGKTQTVEAFCRSLGDDVAVMRGRGSIHAVNTPYHGFGDIVRDLCAPLPEGPNQAAAIKDRLSGTYGLASPKAEELVAEIFRLDAAKISPGEEDNAAARAANIARSLGHVVARWRRERPIVVILEDCHWLDSMSWSLLRLLAVAVPSVLAILTRRSGEPIDDQAASAFLDEARVDRIRLMPLEQGASQELIRQRFRGERVRQDVLDFIYTRAGGQPLFTEHLVDALLKAGQLERESGEWRFNRPEAALETGVHAAVEDIIVSRIDQLPAAVGMTLKTASVLGGEISQDALHAIHPDTPTSNVLASHLTRLESELLVSPAARDGVYVFRHGLVGEVAYRLLPFRQRRELHRRAGLRLEAEHANDLERAYPLLAHHWARAEDPHRAFRYLYAAGMQASAAHASRETSILLGDALTYFDAGTETADKAQIRVNIEHHLGLAHFNLGNPKQSRDHFNRALKLMGFPVPLSLPGQVLSCMRHVAEQVLRRVGVVNTMNTGREAALRATRISTRLSHLSYFANDLGMLLANSLRCLNFAERAGLSGELAGVYAGMATTAAAIPSTTLADSYARRATAMVNRLDDVVANGQVQLFRSIYACSQGRWQTAVELADSALEIHRRLGDRRRLDESLVVLGFSAFFRGEYAAARAEFSRMEESSMRRGDVQVWAWSFLGLAKVELAEGRPHAALRYIARADALESDWLSHIEGDGLRAWCLLDRSSSAALAAAERALHQLSFARPSSFSTLMGTVGCARTLLELAARSPQQGTPRMSGVEPMLRKALRNVVHFSNIFVIAKPFRYELEARDLARRQRPDRALHKASLALRHANALDMAGEAREIERFIATLVS